MRQKLKRVLGTKAEKNLENMQIQVTQRARPMQKKMTEVKPG